MTDVELESLLLDSESDRVERKSLLSDGGKIRQAICAFANDLPDHRSPGVLFVGVDDKGAPTPCPITDQLLQTLASMRDDGRILPLPSMDVLRKSLNGIDVAVVLVHPSSSPPVKYNGTTWIRSGPRRGIANADDERRLSEKRRFRDLPIDIQPVPSAGLDALNEHLFRNAYLPTAVSAEVLRENQRSIEHQLVAVKFAHPGPPASPTILGLLSVGISPSDWVPGAYVQFVRMDGTQLADPIQAAKEVRGPLPELLKDLDDLARINIQTSVNFTSARTEVKTPDYPLSAIQQILRNAIMHRSYEFTNAPVRFYWFRDRIEIQNPGGPFGQVTKANFGQPGRSDYRNPNLAAVMKELGYVQRFGFGIATAREAMKQNGNPEIVFQVEDSHVSVILRSRS